jgi:hypothetical protein
MRQWIGIAGALALAACSGGNDGGDANEAAGNKAAASGGGSAGVTMQPGQWEMTATVTRMTVPGMPAGMNAPLPQPSTTQNCLTAEEVAQANANFINESAGGNEGCTSENSSMSGGRIQATIQCNRPEGQVRMTMAGQYTATTLEMTQQLRTNAQGNNQNVELDSRVTGRRIGDCAPGEQ